MYRAHGVNFYLSSGSAPFLSMEKIIERGLLTWEENRPHPRLMVISMSISKSDTLYASRFWSFSHGAPSLFVLPPEAALEGGVPYVQISLIFERA